MTSAASKKLCLAGDIPDVLLHCPDLQAVILGVGLSLVEKLYNVILQEPTNTSTTARPSKKTKLDPPTTAWSQSGDDEAVGMHPSHCLRGAKPAPKGTGYGGVSSGTDDVRSPFHCSCFIFHIRDSWDVEDLVTSLVILGNHDSNLVKTLPAERNCCKTKPSHLS